MGEISKKFIEQFHGISGDTFAEKHRNLFLLIHENSSSLTENEEELDFIGTNLEPTSYLEKIFKIDFLIHFKRLKELLQEYLKGDEVTLRRIAKKEWFFREAFKNVTSEEFVNNILPTMSYTVKLKILKKLPVDEEKGDDIFDALCERYGLFFATTFLPKCSSNKIRKILTNNLIKLTPSQLQLLCDKDPLLISIYFEERKKHEDDLSFINNNPVLIHTARKYPEVFVKLFEKYKFDIHLGYKTTIKFIDSQKTDVLDKLESYVRILHKKGLVQKLGFQLRDIFFKVDYKRCYMRCGRRRKCVTIYHWQSLLKYYPKHQQFNIFKTFYDATFYQKLEDNTDILTEKVLKVICDPLEREKWAKIKFEKEKDETYLKYVTSDYCLNLLEDKLNNKLDASEKSNYIRLATTSCILNKDLDSLLKMCELVAVRFKDDDVSIRIDFFSALYVNDDILDKLTEPHWKFLMEIISTSQAKNEWIDYDWLIRLKYLEYLINNDKPIREIISQYSDWIVYFENTSVWYKTEVCRKIICELIEVGPHNAENETDRVQYYLDLIDFCQKFNKKHTKNYAINIWSYASLIQAFKKGMEEEYNLNNDIVEYVLCRNESSDLLDELKVLYFKKFETFGQISGCLWFLKHEPKTFQKYVNDSIDTFTTMCHSDRKKIWYFIKKYTHLGLDTGIVEFCNSKLREDHELKEELVEALTILSPADSHLEFMKVYVPTSDKAITTTADEEMKQFNDLQCNLIKLLHLVRSPAIVLPTALQFCKGDFLKFALCPLYSCMYKLPENEVKSIIEKLSQDEVYAVKKHAVHLSCVILDRKTTYNYLNDVPLPSLMPASKYLVKNPSESLWKLVESKLSNLNKNHLHVFKWVVKKTFSLTYKMKYIEAFWSILKEDKEAKKLMFEKMDLGIIQKLPLDLGYKIIQENIFEMEDANEVIASLLIYMNDSNKYEFMSKIFNDFKEKYWSKQTSRRDSRRKLCKFIQTLSKIYFQSEMISEDFADKFSSAFNSIFLPSEAFEEYVIVTLLKLKGKAAENCGEICTEFNNAVIANYGRAIIDLIVGVIKEHVVPHLFENDVMKLCYCVWKAKKSIDDYLLIIKLLPKSEPNDTENYSLYNEVLCDLEQVTDDFIRLQLNLYLKLE